MPPMSKIELYAAIRRDARAGLAMRALQRKYGVGFRTVQRALASAWPEPRKQPRPRATRLDAYKPLIDQLLLADLDAPASSGTPPSASSTGWSPSTTLAS
jgi:transposase